MGLVVSAVLNILLISGYFQILQRSRKDNRSPHTSLTQGPPVADLSHGEGTSVTAKELQIKLHTSQSHQFSPHVLFLSQNTIQNILASCHAALGFSLVCHSLSDIPCLTALTVWRRTIQVFCRMLLGWGVFSSLDWSVVVSSDDSVQGVKLLEWESWLHYSFAMWLGTHSTPWVCVSPSTEETEILPTPRYL